MPVISATPERSLTQRMEALAKANGIRAQRANLKRDLKAGRVSIAQVIDAPPGYVLTAKTYDLLVAAPKFGRVKANRALAVCRINPAKTVGGLTDRQRGELVRRLEQTR